MVESSFGSCSNGHARSIPLGSAIPQMALWYCLCNFQKWQTDDIGLPPLRSGLVRRGRQFSFAPLPARFDKQWHPRATTCFAVPYQDLGEPFQPLAGAGLLHGLLSFLICFAWASLRVLLRAIAAKCWARENPGKLSEAVVSICISATWWRVSGGCGKISATPAIKSHKANGTRISTGRKPEGPHRFTQNHHRPSYRR